MNCFQKSGFIILGMFFTTAFTVAQKRTWYVNDKKVDSFHAPIVSYFSALYDTVFMYDVQTNWRLSKHPFQVFAIKNHQYFKIKGQIGFFIHDKILPDSIAIISQKQCTTLEGAAFMNALEAHNFFALPLDDVRSPCEFFDSATKKTLRCEIEDGGDYQFHFFDKNQYKLVSYYAIIDYNKRCPKEVYKNPIAIIDMFEKDW